MIWRYDPVGADLHVPATSGCGCGKTREDFIKFRTERDAQLSLPKLIIPSLQVNTRAGEILRDDSGARPC